MESNDSDILNGEYKNIFETLFRKNAFTVVLFVIIANGYSNIPGVSELLTDIFGSHILRLIITFILFFQILDNVADSLIWTIIISTGLFIIEKIHRRKMLKNKKLN
jgi:hypothetical protein